MAGIGGPPEGVPGGGPDGEDEFRSVVFDESFVRAAGLHEPSARERIQTGERPRRLRRAFGVPMRSLRFGLAAFLVLTVMAGALYFGARRAALDLQGGFAAPVLLDRVALVPQTPTTGTPPADAFAGSPADAWKDGGLGVTLPDAAATAHFSATEVQTAELLAREFVVGTQIDPAVIRGGSADTAAQLLIGDQRDQMLASLDQPANDGTQAATGWVTRFDPTQVTLLDPNVRAESTMHVTEVNSGDLMVTVDGSFEYALHGVPGGADPNGWTRFVVRRTWEFHADPTDLRRGTIALGRIVTAAGPQPCGADTSRWFAPELSGAAPAPAPAPAAPQQAGVTDPFSLTSPADIQCGALTVY